MTIDLRLMDPSLTVRAIGLTGSDENAGFVRDRMLEAGVDASAVRAVPGAFTSFTDVMTERETGARTFFTARGANSMFAPEHIDFAAIGDCAIFHLAYALLLDSMDAPDPDYGTVMARTLARARRLGFITSIDVVSEISGRVASVVTPSLKHSDYVIINEVEASQITGIPARGESDAALPENIRRMLVKLMACGIGRLACVHAPEGAWCLTHKDEMIFRPSLKLPDGWIKGTVGAGDAFCAGMLYSLNEGWDVYKAMGIGAAAAACVLNRQDGFGVKPIAELERMLQ
jgi:sugar/nucleoside kinase (ribokinase family)